MNSESIIWQWPKSGSLIARNAGDDILRIIHPKSRSTDTQDSQCSGPVVQNPGLVHVGATQMIHGPSSCGTGPKYRSVGLIWDSGLQMVPDHWTPYRHCGPSQRAERTCNFNMALGVAMRFRSPLINIFHSVASSLIARHFGLCSLLPTSVLARGARVDTKDYKGSAEDGNDYASRKRSNVLKKESSPIGVSIQLACSIMHQW